MTEKDIITNWYYFCSIAKQLQNTNQFVDHSINSINEIINGKTYSNEFAKILMLSAAEFETVAKSLCSESGMTLPEKTNIVSITKNVLSAYPQIGFTEIHTPYQMIQPLKNWTTIRTLNAEGKQVEKVSGINWWEAHNEVKHSRFDRFIQANLENCVYSLASLLLGTQPDLVVLCINPQDTIEYIKNTIRYVESITSAIVVATVIFPEKLEQHWAGFGFLSRKMNEGELDCLQNYFYRETERPCYRLTQESVKKMTSSIIDIYL